MLDFRGENSPNFPCIESYLIKSNQSVDFYHISSSVDCYHICISGLSRYFFSMEFYDISYQWTFTILIFPNQRTFTIFLYKWTLRYFLSVDFSYVCHQWTSFISIFLYLWTFPIFVIVDFTAFLTSGLLPPYLFPGGLFTIFLMSGFFLTNEL